MLNRRSLLRGLVGGSALGGVAAESIGEECASNRTQRLILFNCAAWWNGTRIMDERIMFRIFRVSMEDIFALNIRRPSPNRSTPVIFRDLEFEHYGIEIGKDCFWAISHCINRVLITRRLRCKSEYDTEFASLLRLGFAEVPAGFNLGRHYSIRDVI